MVGPGMISSTDDAATKASQSSIGMGSPEKCSWQSGAEARGRPGLCAFGFDGAVARLGGGDQRTDQPCGARGHLVDRAFKGFLVGLGRHAEAAELAHELQRGGADLLLGGGRLEVVEGLDASAHGALSGCMQWML